MNEIEKNFLKYLKEPIIILLEDLFEDLKLVCDRLKKKLIARKNLNYIIMKKGVTNYQFKLENFKKEEKVQIDEVENFLKQVNMLIILSNLNSFKHIK